MRVERARRHVAAGRPAAARRRGALGARRAARPRRLPRRDARGARAARRLSLDGQGLVRARSVGALELDADFDPELLRHVWVLKLSDEEAEVLGDPPALGVREVAAHARLARRDRVRGGRVEHVPAFALDGDPTGAGDAFSAAYLAGAIAGFAPAAAARRATAVVASVLLAG